MYGKMNNEMIRARFFCFCCYLRVRACGCVPGCVVLFVVKKKKKKECCERGRRNKVEAATW